MENIQTFEHYIKLGYKVIPIHYQTKTPIFKSWNKNYDYSKMHTFVKNSTLNLNFGILLGEIIDIEGDCEQSNHEIDNLLNKIPHPIFQSKKSKHHLFRNNIKNLTRIVKDGIEYRAYRHQSVIPPSFHENGTKYEWITDVYNFIDIPYLPLNIANYLSDISNKNKTLKKKRQIKPNHVCVACAACLNKNFLHQVRFKKELKILNSMGHRWKCRKCRPLDLRDLIRKF